jgi:hypothetical protein
VAYNPPQFYRVETSVLSIIVPVRNVAQMAADCLSSVSSTFTTLSTLPGTQFILIDDCSDPETGVLDILRRLSKPIPARRRSFTERRGSFTPTPARLAFRWRAAIWRCFSATT